MGKTNLSGTGAGSRQEAAEPPTLATTRRGFLKGMGFVAGASLLVPSHSEAENASGSADKGFTEFGSAAISISLMINGESRSLTVEPRTTLLEALRVHLDLTGSKEICDRGACGGCTVLANGKAVNSCLMLAVDAQGVKLTTVEGIAADPRYAPLVEAYCEHDAAQCGFCIPGFLVSSASLLNEIPQPTAEQVRHGLAGNTCRCGTYSKIFDAMDACSKKGGLSS